MAEITNTQQPTAKASTTAPAPYIPEALRGRIEAHHATLARSIRAFGKRHKIPQRITAAVVADLKDFLRNDYQGLNLDVAGITYIGANTTREEWAKEVGDDFALTNLFDDYGRTATLARLAGLRADDAETLKASADKMLQQNLKTCGPLALYEWARYVTEYDPDYINGELLHKAQVARYVDFLIYAAIKFNANAAQLLQVEPPQLVQEYQEDDQRSLIVDEVISGILSAPLQLDHLLGLHDNLEEDNQDKDKARPSMQYGSSITDQPTPTAATAQEIAETASTIQKRILVLYQPNTATLARPIEAKKDDLMAAEVVTRGLDGFRTSKPLPLSQIIATLGENTAISATRVTQCLQALQIIAQEKPDKIVDAGNGNEYYSYSDRSITRLARLIIGTPKPNAQELREVGLALGFLTTLRIGHDEDRQIGGSKRTQRRRYYTQFLMVPEIWTKLNHLDQEEGDPHLTLLIHRLIPTGRRSDKQIVEDGLKQTIAQPLAHLVSQEELDLARKLFKGDQGIRFYNYLKSAGHIREPDLMGAVFDYQGQRAAARQRAASVLEAARSKAAYCNTQEEADALTHEARKQADAITRAADENIRRHKPRDRQRLYGWLQDAMDNFIIRSFQVTDAKDGTTDGQGKPIKVITWDTNEKDE